MSDNYEDETRPLFRHLRTEAFRFIIVRFNHYSFLKRLENDLKSHFPERPLVRLDAEKHTFQSLSTKYYAQENGFFWIENFDNLLRENQDETQNQRKHEITAGLNLRRDTLAKKPIALFIFVRADEELYARLIMHKMPDLWSFRSLILDLEREIVPKDENLFLQDFQDIQILEKEQIQAKTEELEKLQAIVAQTSATEVALLDTLYPQIVDLQKELGKYEEVLITCRTWEKIASDKAFVFFHIAYMYKKIGKIEDAQNYFRKALFEWKQNNHQNNIALVYEQLGNIELQKGNTEKALDFFEKETTIFEKLYEEQPNELLIKHGLAIAYQFMGIVYAKLESWEKALLYYEKYNQFEQELHENAPEHLDIKHKLALSYERLGNAHRNLGNQHKVLFFYEEFNQLMKELYQSEPTNLYFKNNLAASYERLGLHAKERDNKTEAKEYYLLQSQKLRKELVQQVPSNSQYRNGLQWVEEKLKEISEGN